LIPLEQEIFESKKRILSVYKLLKFIIGPSKARICIRVYRTDPDDYKDRKIIL